MRAPMSRRSLPSQSHSDLEHNECRTITTQWKLLGSRSRSILCWQEDISFATALSSRYDGQPLTIVFGAMRDKAIGEIAEILFPLANQVIATTVNSPRAASAEEIHRLAAHVGTEIVTADTLAGAIDLARQHLRP